MVLVKSREKELHEMVQVDTTNVVYYSNYLQQLSSSTYEYHLKPKAK